MGGTPTACRSPCTSDGLDSTTTLSAQSLEADTGLLKLCRNEDGRHCHQREYIGVSENGSLDGSCSDQGSASTNSAQSSSTSVSVPPGGRAFTLKESGQTPYELSSQTSDHSLSTFQQKSFEVRKWIWQRNTFLIISTMWVNGNIADSTWSNCYKYFNWNLYPFLQTKAPLEMSTWAVKCQYITKVCLTEKEKKKVNIFWTVWQFKNNLSRTSNQIFSNNQPRFLSLCIFSLWRILWMYKPKHWNVKTVCLKW